ncbi:MAG: sensor histidine kinase [Brevibacterium linens]
MNWLARIAYLGFVAGDTKALTIIHQVSFAILLGASAALLSALRPDSAVADDSMLAGAGLLLVATLGAVYSEKFSRAWVPNLVIPLLDFLALGLCRWATYPDGGVLSILAFTPVVWLVTSFRTRGALISVAAVLITLTPVSLFDGERPVDAARIVLALIQPVAVILVSAMIIGLETRLSSTNLRLSAAFDRQRDLTRDLQRTSTLLRGTGASVDVGVKVLDENGTTVFENPAFATHLNAAVAQMTGEQDSPADAVAAGVMDAGVDEVDMFRADGITRIPPSNSPVTRARRGERFSDELIWVSPQDGEQLALSVTAVGWQGHPSIAPHTIVTTQDVTATQQLIRARERILASVSHELRTPLTSIMGYTELALDELDDGSPTAASAIASYLTVVQRNSDQLLTMVEDILRTQQTQSNRFELKITEFELTPLIDDVVAQLRSTAADQEVELAVEATGEPVLTADPQRIGQVLTNLVVNGIKYSGRGHHVTVKTQSDALGAGFDVVDDGAGIPAAEVDQLFTAFFRGAAAQASSQRGVGLGLALVKGIVDAHAGTITVSSIEGAGSTFSVRIPSRDEGIRP